MPAPQTDDFFCKGYMGPPWGSVWSPFIWADSEINSVQYRLVKNLNVVVAPAPPPVPPVWLPACLSLEQAASGSQTKVTLTLCEKATQTGRKAEHHAAVSCRDRPLWFTATGYSVKPLYMNGVDWEEWENWWWDESSMKADRYTVQEKKTSDLVDPTVDAVVYQWRLIKIYASALEKLPERSWNQASFSRSPWMNT